MNFKHQSFITEYLRHRNAYTAYCLAYNVQDESNYDSIMSAANRLLNRPDVNSIITSVLENIRREVEEEIRTELKTELLTIQHKRELLAKIATGQTYAVQHYKGKDCSQCTQMVTPTINQMLRAIDLDNKMAGHYPISLKTEPVHTVPKTQQIATEKEIIAAPAMQVECPISQPTDCIPERLIPKPHISAKPKQYAHVQKNGISTLNQQITTNNMVCTVQSSPPFYPLQNILYE